MQISLLINKRFKRPFYPFQHWSNANFDQQTNFWMKPSRGPFSHNSKRFGTRLHIPLYICLDRIVFAVVASKVLTCKEFY